MKPTLAILRDRASYSSLSEPALAAVEQIAASDDPEAIKVLASLLDIPGVVGTAAVRALIARGLVVEDAMRACLDSDDSDMIDRAQHVLDAIHGVPSIEDEMQAYADLEDLLAA